MKQLRIFAAILFLFIFISTPLIFQLQGFSVYNVPYFFLHILIFYIPSGTVWILTLVFFIYLLLIKDNFKYWSVFFLGASSNLGAVLLFDIPGRVINYIKNAVEMRKDSYIKFLYEITLARISGWIFTFILLTGFICLFFYFRNKFKHSNSIYNKI